MTLMPHLAPACQNSGNACATPWSVTAMARWPQRAAVFTAAGRVGERVERGVARVEMELHALVPFGGVLPLRGGFLRNGGDIDRHVVIVAIEDHVAAHREIVADADLIGGSTDRRPGGCTWKRGCCRYSPSYRSSAPRRSFSVFSGCPRQRPCPSRSPCRTAA